MLKTPTILIVDDDPSVRKSLQRLIRSAGLKARTFSSAEEFLQTPDRPVADCLIFDVRMPGMDGFELYKALPERDAAPVIFITAHDDDTHRTRARKVGAFEFLSKPVDDKSLIGTIHRAIRRAS